MLHVADDVVNVAGDRPEEFLDHGAGAQVDQAKREAVQRLVTDLQGIVPVLKQTSLVDFIPDFVDVTYQLIIALADGIHLVIPLGQGSGLEHVHDEHRVMGRERASALVDDIGMLKPVLVAGIDKRINCVVDILLDAVVH